MSKNRGSIIFQCPSEILNLIFSMRFWSGTIWGGNHLSMSRLNLKFKIYGELLVGDIRGVNHLFMSKLNLKFKIFSEIPVGDNVGGQSSFHVQDGS